MHRSFLAFLRSVCVCLPRSLLIAAFLATSSVVFAGNTWDGGGGDNFWTTAANWSSDTLPTYGTLTFSGSANLINTNNNGSYSMNGINFNSSSDFILRGNTVDFFDNGGTQAKIENNSTGAGTIDFAVDFEATAGTARGEINPINGNITFNSTVNMNGSGVNEIHVYGSNSKTLTFNGAISGSSKAFKIKQNNIIVFNSANTYSGNTEIDIGEIWIGASGDISASSSIFVGNGGATADDCKFFLNDSDGGLTFSRTININDGDGTEQNRELGGLNTSGTNTFSGTIVRTGSNNKTVTLYVGSGGTVAFSGDINGDDTVMKRGAGTVRFSGANSYSANTEINAGGLHIAQGGSIAGGTVYVGLGSATGTAAEFLIADTDGGTTVNRALVINPGSGGNRTIGGNNTSGTNTFGGTITRDSDADDESVTLTATSGGLVDYTNTLSGNDTVYVTGGGVTRYSLVGKTYTGATVVSNSSTLRINAANLIDDGSALTVVTGATFDMTNNAETVGSIAGGGSITMGTAQLIAGQDNTSTTFSGIISGASPGSFVKKGTGTLVLSGTNSYNGNTFVVGGSLRFNTNQVANFSGEIRLGETTGSDAATLSIGVGGVAITNAVLVRSGSSGTKTIDGTNSSGTATFSGPVVLSNDVTVAALLSGGTLAFTSAFYGSNGVRTATLNGAGTVSFSGADNNTNLAMSATAGTVQLGKTSSSTVHALDSGLTVGGALVQLTGTGRDQVYSNSALTVNSGRLDLNGKTNACDALNGSGGAITNSTGTSLLIVGSGGTGGSYSGTIVSGGGTIALVKFGAGTLTLSGNSSFGGGTTMGSSAGQININHANALGTGALFINGANNSIDNTSGGTITIPNVFALTNGSPTFVGSNPLRISGGTSISGGNRTITVTANTLTLNGAVSEIGSRQLTKAGAGTLVLGAAAGTWTGGAQLNAGTLSIGNDNALGTGTLTLNGGTIQSTDATRSISNTTVVTASTTVGGTNAFTFNGPGTFTFSGGSRTLTVNNTGTTTINGSAYLSDDNSTTGRGQTLGGTGNVTINGAVANNNAGDTVPVNFTNSNSGTLIFNGTNTYSGVTIANAGTLQINANQGSNFSSAGIRLGDTTGSAAVTLAIGAGGVTVTNAITVRAGSSGTKTIAANNTTGTATFSGPVTMSNALTVAANAGGTLTISGAINNNGSNLTATTTGTINLNGIVSGGGKLVKAGAGTVSLGAAHSYTGNTEIDLGTLSVASGGDIANGSAVFIGNGTSGGNATLDLAASGVDVGSTIQANTDPGAATRTITSTAASGTTTLSGNVNLNNTLYLTATSGSTLALTGRLRLDNSGNQQARFSGNATISGVVTSSTGAAEVYMTGPSTGTLQISGDNTHSGYKLVVYDGTLYLNHTGALGRATSYPDKINFTTNNSTLRVGASMTHASMGMTFAGVSPAFQIDSGITFSVGGAVDKTSGTVTITKTGTGTLTFTGTSVSNDVGMVVGAGTFKGTGVSGTMNVYGGGAINPGSSPGTMNAGATDWGTNGVYVWEINDFAGTYGADPGWDKLNVTGALTVSATTGQTFTVALTSLNGGAAGAAANFTNTTIYTRSIATATSISGFSADKFMIDTNGFQHDLNGGSWVVTNTATTIDLVFTPSGFPNLSAGPNRSFTTMLGSAPATQTFGVTNTNVGTMTYTNTVTYGSGASGWASIAPAPSPLTGGTFLTHTVTVSVVGATGTFHATNTITGNQTNGNQTVVFTLTVTNIPPPAVPTATVDGKEMVRLAWTKITGLDTLILAKTNSITTDPTQGAAYSAGATIDGATVIYKGSGATLEHVVAPSRTNFCKFYAVNNDYYSTNEVGASAVTVAYRTGEIVEAFAYTNGVALSGLAGGQGWSAGWVTGAQGTKLVETNYSATGVPYFPTIGNYPATAANRLHFSDPGNGSTNRAERSFSVISTGKIYAACMLAYQFQGASKWSGISLMSNTTEKVFAGKIGSAANRTLGLDGVGGQTASSPTYEIWPYGAPGDTGKVYVVVLKYDFSTRVLTTKAYDRTQTVPTAEPATWDATDTLAAGDIVTINGVRVHAGSSDLGNTVGESYFDEVRVATNWFELLNMTGPVLDLYPTNLTFTATLGQNPATQTQTFTVSNINAGTMSYTSLVSYSVAATGWLAVAPATGLVGAASGVLSTGTGWRRPITWRAAPTRRPTRCMRARRGLRRWW